MKYDFTTILERRDAMAYTGVGKDLWGMSPEPPEEGRSFIPMWVADMNFATAPSVTEAVRSRLDDPTFGYFLPEDEYYGSIMRWHRERNGASDLGREHIGYENGVHGQISTAIEVLTEPGDSVFLQKPYYAAFETDIRMAGRRTAFSQLVQDGDGKYRMDYEEMDRVLRESGAKLAIFCSPHNPTGRVWTREELEKAMDVFRANDCYVLSDEIWSDIVFSGHSHIPAQLVNEWAREHVMGAYAPGKTFNVAGLIGSYHIIYNPELRRRLKRYADGTNYNKMNLLSMYAQIGAYSPEGAEWTGELLQVLEGNAEYAYDFVKNELPLLRAPKPEGTYMFFVDCGEYMKKSGRDFEEILKAGWRAGVGWEDGRIFGGERHVRMNLALPRSLEEEAFRRLKELVFI